MGEAKRSAVAARSATQRQIGEHPFCCYCGGLKPATTIDHQPPKILFPNKHRPKGLEFSACEDCNRASSGDDAVFALASRMTGSLRSGVKLPDAPFRGLVGTVEAAYPGLPASMLGPRDWRTVNGVHQVVSHFRFDSLVLAKSLCRTAAKLALSIFYQENQRAVSSGAESDAKRTVNTTQAGQQYDEAGQLVRTGG